ncbi:MAG: isochorismatase family protein [Bacteroidota bacterium]
MVKKTAGIALKLIQFTIIFTCSFRPVAAQESRVSHDTCIIVLDVQQAFYKRPSLQLQAAEMVRYINNLTATADPDKVIYVRAAGKALSITSRGFSVDTLTPETDSNLHLVSDHIFTKMSGNAFASEELTGFLKKMNASEIILTGLMAEKCIYDSALGGIERGYKISILPEAVIGSSPAKKEKALRKLEEKGIRIIRAK